ncbi:MAG TPA: hypothetical protein VK711_00020 [Puia sp.]|nr:hypothetical protein [Puia sp.]
MKKIFLPCLIIAMSVISHPAFSQSKTDTASLGMAGDNLDLYAVLDLFLKSKTIEDFEKSLNDTKSKINNLDLDLDKKIDFIKVVTKKEGDSYTFVLQDAVSKTETQDVAVILVNRDKDKKVNVQIVGDPDLYGKDYVIEPKTSPTPAVTANPAYTGADPAKDVPASTTTVVVQSAPIVQYVYSPAYVPYYPPYYYGYYPPYFAMATVLAVGIYRHNNWYHHGGYYGGHYGGGNTVIINNRNQINHYNNTRNTSNRVQHNNASGNYGNGNRGSASTRPSNGASGSNRPSASTRPSTGASGSTRPSASNNMSSRSSSAGSRSSGGFSGGGSRGGGGFSGSRGGGGGGRRR